MKSRIIIFAFITLTMAACNRNNNKSDAYGNFEATNEITVSSEANGKLMTFNVNEGDHLKKGQIVGFVDTTQLHLKKEQLEAAMAATKSKTSNIFAQINVLQEQLKTLEKDRDRIGNMLKDSAATQRQWDDINGKVNVVKKQIQTIQTQHAPVLNEVKSYQMQIGQIEDQISKSVITSPITGVVLEKYAEPDEVTAFGKPLFKITDLNKMVLRAYISGDQLTSVKVGQKVKVLADAPNGKYVTKEGTISWISSDAEFTPKMIQTKEERVNLVYAMKIDVNNNDRAFKIGMPGEMRLK